MKIEGNGIKFVTAGTVAEDKGQPARQGARQDESPTSSSVQLSALSSRMREIESRLSDTQVVDTARVAEIKEAISAGRFKVNPEVVADNLISTVRELINSHKA